MDFVTRIFQTAMWSVACHTDLKNLQCDLWRNLNVAGNAVEIFGLAGSYFVFYTLQGSGYVELEEFW